jgi:mannitol-1-phosphate 5-dehydrogenase
VALRSVVFGAGNIGRGFIGMLLAESGYEVVFVEADAALAAALNGAGRYPVRALSGGGARDTWVEGVSAIDAADADAAAGAVAAADIAATAVGARALEKVAPVLAEGLRRRYTAGASGEDARVRPLDILICENLPDAGERLAAWVAGAAADDRTRALIAGRTGFVETSVGRMTPIQTEAMRDGNPLRICAEPYAVLPVDADAFRGPVPHIKGMEPHRDFGRYVRRKLYIHNMGHSSCAYLGMEKGYRYIADAIRDDDVRGTVEGAMRESADALCSVCGEDRAELHAHVDDLVTRFGNRALGDTCARVGADAARKLGPLERFAGALDLCREAGVNHPNLDNATAAARRAAGPETTMRRD